jgi:hypothetical protein
LSETTISSRCRSGTFFKSACSLLLSFEHLFLLDLGFKTKPVDTARLGCCSVTWLKRIVYGDLNSIQSSRGLEREADRNVEWMWLLGRLAPDFKAIADCTKDNGKALKITCRECFGLCR